MKLLVLFLLLSPLFGVEPWIQEQIDHDLAPFKDGYCQNCLFETFERYNGSHSLFLVVSGKGAVHFIRGKDLPAHHERFIVIKNFITPLLHELHYPETVLLISLGDSWPQPIESPVWVMCKSKHDNKILFPDFEAIDQRYNIFPRFDLEKNAFPVDWKERRDLMIWRGSGAQGPINSENMDEKSRVTLCKLSEAYPDLIDAGLTFCIPKCLERFRKARMPIEEICSHRYQMWIDGNASSYSNSGWRLYTGSTVFKEESDYTQWYYRDLQPWIHYVPVEKGLGNLVESLLELRENADLAEQIAHNGRAFALTHITGESIKTFTQELLKAYLSCPTSTACERCR